MGTPVSLPSSSRSWHGREGMGMSHYSAGGEVSVLPKDADAPPTPSGRDASGAGIPVLVVS